MFVIVGLGLLVFGGGAAVIRVADGRGRNGLAWGVASMAGAAIAVWAGWAFLSSRATTAPGDISYLLVAALVLMPAGFHVMMALVVSKLHPPVGRTRASSWPMALIGEDDNNCDLALGRTSLLINGNHDAVTQDIPFDELRDVRADGECVRIQWQTSDTEREAVLRPMKGAKDRDGRIRLVGAIARRINKRVEAAGSLG